MPGTADRSESPAGSLAQDQSRREARSKLEPPPPPPPEPESPRYPGRAARGSPGSPGGGCPAGSAAGRGAGGRRPGGGCGARSRRRGRGAVGRVVVGGDRTRPRRGGCARGSKVAEGAAGPGGERRSGGGGVPQGGVTPRRAHATALRSAGRRERRVARARGAGAETAGRELWGGCVGAAAGRSRETGAPRAASPGISRAPWASSGEVLGQRHLPRHLPRGQAPPPASSLPPGFPFLPLPCFSSIFFFLFFFLSPALYWLLFPSLRICSLAVSTWPAATVGD